jgi:hypothetical protein
MMSNNVWVISIFLLIGKMIVVIKSSSPVCIIEEKEETKHNWVISYVVILNSYLSKIK